MKRILAFLFVLILLLSGCSANGGSNSNGSSEEASKLLVSQTVSWDNNQLLETAKKLLKQDKLITDLFIGVKLAELVDVSGKNAIEFTPATGTEYENFSVIEKLLTSTYTEAGGTIKKFLTFPKYGNRSIMSVEGKTYFSFHYKEAFTGIDINSIIISDGSNYNIKKITAGTYTLSMVYDGSSWLLENSVYFLNKEAASTAENLPVFTAMNKGTAKALSGKVLVVEIFINDKVNAFTEDDKTAFKTKVNDSISFLTKTAASYNNSFQVEYKELNYTHNSETNLTTEPYDFDIILAKTSFGNINKYITDNFDVSGYSSYFAVLCVNKEGSGYAQAYTKDETNIDSYYCERCVLFTNDDATLLTRNILSIFGTQVITDEYLKNLMTSYNKNDIMLGTVGIDSAALSELTAYQAGITKLLDKQFYVFYNEVS